MTANKQKSGDPRDKALSFEEAYTRLEKTVQTLEQGGLTLEETARLFEEGMRLARACNERLDVTELRLTQVQTRLAEQMDLFEEKPES
ncbi:MAG: exodeoxyribonuclease VII small subunit [Chloroflexota bacterium]